jgi:YD repeat-containing protein
VPVRVQCPLASLGRCWLRLCGAGNESSRSGTYTGAAGSGAVTTSYTYDAENHLTRLQSDSTVIGTYAYDGAGNRYAKTAGGVTTAYTLDLASGLPGVLAETAGSSVTSYAYAGGPIAKTHGALVSAEAKAQGALNAAAGQARGAANAAAGRAHQP